MKTANEKFKQYIEFLKVERGVSYAAIAANIGMNGYKIKAIRIGKSSANEIELAKLVEAYPILREHFLSEAALSNSSTLDYSKMTDAEFITVYKELLASLKESKELWKEKALNLEVENERLRAMAEELRGRLEGRL